MTDVIVLDPLMNKDEADAIVELWRRFPTYGLYSNEGFPTTFAPELGQTNTSAYQLNIQRLATQIVSMMESPW